MHNINKLKEALSKGSVEWDVERAYAIRADGACFVKTKESSSHEISGNIIPQQSCHWNFWGERVFFSTHEEILEVRALVWKIYKERVDGLLHNSHYPDWRSSMEGDM